MTQVLYYHWRWTEIKGFRLVIEDFLKVQKSGNSRLSTPLKYQ